MHTHYHMPTTLTRVVRNNTRSTSPTFILMLIFSVFLALFTLSPSVSYAQDSIDELDRNVNASGRKRLNTEYRVLSEIGLGVAGELLGAGLWWEIHVQTRSTATPPVQLTIALLGLVTTTTIASASVYLGGWATGGRGKAWAPFVGGYAGMLPGLLFALCVPLPENEEDKKYASKVMSWGIAASIVLGIAGAVIGYELSEKHETNRLKSERDKLNQASAPIMFQLYSGSF